MFLNEYAPPRYIARSLQQVLLQSSLYTHIPTRGDGIQGSTSPTVLTQIRITLSVCYEAGTLLGTAERLAATAREPFLTR